MTCCRFVTVIKAGTGGWLSNIESTNCRARRRLLSKDFKGIRAADVAPIRVGTVRVLKGFIRGARGPDDRPRLLSEIVAVISAWPASPIA
jgi:hypothetical protein